VILFLAENPRDTDRLALDREAHALPGARPRSSIDEKWYGDERGKLSVVMFVGAKLEASKGWRCA